MVSVLDSKLSRCLNSTEHCGNILPYRALPEASHYPQKQSSTTDKQFEFCLIIYVELLIGHIIMADLISNSQTLSIN